MNKYTHTYIQKLAEEMSDSSSSNKREKEKLTFMQKAKRTIRDMVTGAAVGAGAGGVAGGMGAETIRDLVIGARQFPGSSFYNEMSMPVGQVRAASVPLGILGGAGLGALGGLVLPPMYRK